MALQSVIGVLSSSCMAGIVFAKLARPKNRMHTVMFSKNAVISMRNGSLYLLCRVANMRKSLLIEAHVRGKIIYRSKTTAEGEKNLFYQEALKVRRCTQLHKRVPSEMINRNRFLFSMISWNWSYRFYRVMWCKSRTRSICF